MAPAEHMKGLGFSIGNCRKTEKERAMWKENGRGWGEGNQRLPSG